MTDYFPAAVEIVLESEGVFSDDKNDPGGETYYGVARASHPDIPWPPTKGQAVAIYRAEYWDKHRCSEMPWRWALGIFDGQVNQGSVIRLAQRALVVTVDGIVGPSALDAMQKSIDWHFANFIARRAKAYIALPLFPNDGDGWLTRLANIAYRAGQGP